MWGKQPVRKTTEKSNDCIFCHLSVGNVQKMQFLSWNWLIFQTNVYHTKEKWLFTVAVNYWRLLQRKVWEINNTFHRGQDVGMEIVCIYILASSWHQLKPFQSKCSHSDFVALKPFVFSLESSLPLTTTQVYVQTHTHTHRAMQNQKHIASSCYRTCRIICRVRAMNIQLKKKINFS